MKHWGAHKTIGIASAGVALVLAGTIAWLLNKPPTTNCGAEAPADSKIHTIHPTKVVVQPWQGRHQIYGIFVVPNRYRDERRYAAALNVRGVTGLSVTNGSAEYGSEDEISGGPGHYVKRGYIPTRVALWFLFTGRFGDLRAPCHWTLGFVHRAQ